MQASDYISIAALVVAIVGTIYSVWYTKRTFEASNYPMLDINPNLRMNTLSLSIHNFSINIVISDLNIHAFITNRTYFISNKNKLALDFGRRSPKVPINPLSKTAYDISIFELLANIAKQFPSVLTPLDQEEVNPAVINYRVIEDDALRLVVTYSYQPAIYNAKRITKKKSYRIKLKHANIRDQNVFHGIELEKEN